jgi:hypothetical protein
MIEGSDREQKEFLAAETLNRMEFEEFAAHKAFIPDMWSSLAIFRHEQIYWEMCWKWHYRDLFNFTTDWDRLHTEIFDSDAAPGEDELNAVVSCPNFKIVTRAATEYQFTHKQLATYMATLKIFWGDLSLHALLEIFHDQTRVGIKERELTKARRLYDEKGVNLVECLFDPDSPVLACPWPKQTS